MNEFFLGFVSFSLRGFDCILGLSEKCEEFYICVFCENNISELDKRVWGEISVEARKTQARGDLML